jgi:hypothetical protein
VSPRLLTPSELARLLRRASALPGHERLLRLRAWALLLAVPPALRLLPFTRVLGLLEKTAMRARRRPVSAERLAFLVDAAGRHHVFTPTCLHRALVLYGLLSAHDGRAELILGTRRAGGTLEAHAWLERAGSGLPAAANAASYQPLLRWKRERTR